MNVQINYEGGRKFTTKIREFTFQTDLPEKRNGTNTAPTPTEIFVGALGCCVGTYVVNYLDQVAKTPAEKFSINIDWDLTDEPRKVNQVNIALNLPEEVVGKRREAILKVAHHCTIHNALESKPEVNISFQE